MTAARLLSHYDRIADAPDAIPRLRSFILDLAVRGKLVPQDANDESASQVLKRFGATDGLEGPFQLPGTWAWARVGTLAEARLGKMLDKAKNKGEPRPYLRNLNVRWFDFDLTDLLEMRFENFELAEFALIAGDVLICEGGEPGRAAVWDERESGIYFQKAVHRVRFRGTVEPYYFVKALRASADDGRLAEYFTGTGIQHLTGRGLGAFVFPLPPLAEQRRIVAKVDELMALCDQLEAAQKEREATRDRLAAATLARLNAPDPDRAAFVRHARFALHNIDSLTTRSDQVRQLRQTILNLAVRGKLVPQEPTDEPAAELLWRIAAEKARLAGHVLSRGRRSDGRERTKEFEFSLPPGWALSTLGSVALKITDGAHQTPTYVGSGVPFVSVKDFSAGRLRLSNTRLITEAEHRLLYRRCDPKRGDILIGRIGTLGHAVLVDTDDEFSLFVSVGLVRFSHENMAPEFLRTLLNSPLVEGEFDRIKIGGGTHTNKLNLGDLQTVALPIPPLAEQHRIVAKVDELMALCDHLETSLSTIDDTRRRLLDAVLAEGPRPAERPTAEE